MDENDASDDIYFTKIYHPSSNNLIYLSHSSHRIAGFGLCQYFLVT